MTMAGLPDPDTMTRQPGAPSAGDADTVGFDEQISPEEALAEARAQKEAAERDRDAARAREATLQRERDDALTRETQANTRVMSVEEQAVATAISAQTGAIDQAKTAYANARAAGDTLAEAEALDQMADARAALRSLNEHKQRLEQQKANPPTRQQTRSDGVNVRTPGGEMVASQAAKAWMDEHPRFYDDRSYYNHAVAAHSTILADGIQEGSPAYFKALSEQMKEFEGYEAYKRGDTREQQQVTDTPRAPQRMQPRASSMGAPPSRSSMPAARNGAPDANAIARQQGVEVDDLRTFARINGYTAARYGGDEAKAFNAYLTELQNISNIERAGGDTGMRVDGAWR